MNRKWFGGLIKTLILLVSFGIVFYKIKEFHGNSADKLKEILLPENGMIFLLIVLLMCLNWFLEAVKWKYLIRGIQNITLVHSLHSVLVGVTAGLLTPKRLGEVGGRIILLKKENQLKGIPAFGLGSIIQTSVTVFIGIIAGVILIINYTTVGLENFNLMLIIASIFLLLLLFFIFNLPLAVKWLLRIPWLRKYEPLFNPLVSQSRKKTARLLGIGLTRYIIFSFQFFLLIRLFDQSAGIVESFTGIGLTYFIMTFLPLSSLLELGVRGSVAGFVFGLFTIQTGSGVMAVLCLWVINLGIPALGGAFILHHLKHIETELFSLNRKFHDAPFLKHLSLTRKPK